MGWRVDTDIQQMLRDSAQGYLESSGGPAHFRAVRASETGLDATAWKAMAELGWTGILLPESAGGADLGMEPALTLAEEMGRAIAPEPFVACAVMAATVLAGVQAAPAARLAAGIAAGEATATLAWQERTGQVGADLCATRVAGGRLSGRKLHVAGWHPQASLLVWAQGDEGDAVVLVAPGSEGLRVTPRRMTDGSFEADLVFDHMPLGDDDIMLSGPSAREAVDRAVARGTLALSAQLEGLASAMWQRTADYIRQRVQFGQPLADFQALRHRMVDLFGEIEMAGASWRKAARSDGEADGRMALHAAKARCSQTALDMARWSIQYHGAIGYTDEYDLGLYVHAALRWASWLGNAPAHRRLALAAHRQGA